MTGRPDFADCSRDHLVGLIERQREVYAEAIQKIVVLLRRCAGAEFGAPAAVHFDRVAEAAEGLAAVYGLAYRGRPPARLALPPRRGRPRGRPGGHTRRRAR